MTSSSTTSGPRIGNFTPTAADISSRQQANELTTTTNGSVLGGVSSQSLSIAMPTSMSLSTNAVMESVSPEPDTPSLLDRSMLMTMFPNSTGVPPAFSSESSDQDDQSPRIYTSAAAYRPLGAFSRSPLMTTVYRTTTEVTAGDVSPERKGSKLSPVKPTEDVMPILRSSDSSMEFITSVISRSISLHDALNTATMLTGSSCGDSNRNEETPSGELPLIDEADSNDRVVIDAAADCETVELEDKRSTSNGSNNGSSDIFVIENNYVRSFCESSPDGSDGADVGNNDSKSSCSIIEGSSYAEQQENSAGSSNSSKALDNFWAIAVNSTSSSTQMAMMFSLVDPTLANTSTEHHGSGAEGQHNMLMLSSLQSEDFTDHAGAAVVDIEDNILTINYGALRHSLSSPMQYTPAGRSRSSTTASAGDHKEAGARQTTTAQSPERSHVLIFPASPPSHYEATRSNNVTVPMVKQQPVKTLLSLIRDHQHKLNTDEDHGDAFVSRIVADSARKLFDLAAANQAVAEGQQGDCVDDSVLLLTDTSANGGNQNSSDDDVLIQSQGKDDVDSESLLQIPTGECYRRLIV
jgi:hypothetical protein